VLLAQQGAPATPHLVHILGVVVVVELPHTMPASVQAVPVVQQAWPSLPHFMHDRRPVLGMVTHPVPTSVQRVPVEQQASPSLPHSQTPAAQVPA
jgi:hypothetical protein